MNTNSRKFQVGDVVEFESIGGTVLGQVTHTPSSSSHIILSPDEYLITRYDTRGTYYRHSEYLRYVGSPEIANFLSI